VPIRDDISEIRDDVKGLTGLVARLETTVGHLSRSLEDEREGAKSYRKTMYEQVAGLSQHFWELKRDVTAMTPKVEEITTELDEITKKKHEAAGRRQMLSVIWAGALMLAGLFAWGLAELRGWFLPRH
jgi:hypothetical protein